ncbi:hypothetical protein [Halorussus halobius]|uniref:hypothetical protein n=1 Tax=Halorussus halobius TaxID=1710537 RepID=UPI001092A2AD|nr:hypothetical protein [Halorussus halobius]
MKRRPFLLAASAVATAGCLGTSGSPMDAASSAPTTDADRSPSNRATTEPTASDAHSTRVERVETYDYAVRMNDLGDDPGGALTAFADLDDRERRVVERALDGGYETDDPPAWLASFLAGTEVVERADAYYRLDHDLPTTTITAETVDGSAVDGSVADYEAYEAAVTHDGRVMSGLLRIARDGGAEFTHVWPSLREFLDSYSAVDYRGDVVSVSVDVEDDGPPYAVTASETSVPDVVPADVWDVSHASEETRALVRRAGAYEGAYGFDDAPDGFVDALDAHRYAFLDGTFYTTHVEKRVPAPVALTAEFVDGELELELRNDADRELTVETGAPPPFGVLSFRPVEGSERDDSDGDDGRRTLWTDAYEESDHVHTEGGEVKSVNSIGLAVTLAPGETTGERYEVSTGDLPSGEYVVDLSLGVESGKEGDDANATARYRVVFSV